MAARSDKPIFRVWLPFFVVSTGLSHVALTFAASAMQRAEVDPVVQFVVGLLVPAPVTFLAFCWAVMGLFAAAGGDADRATPTVGVPWLVYFVAYTVAGYVLSVLVGAMVGAVYLNQRKQFDPDAWWLLIFVSVFALGPASWTAFRWVVTRYYANLIGGTAGPAPQP
jgi:hypothetical protein